MKPTAAQERWDAFGSLKSLALVREGSIPSENHEPFRWNLRVWISPDALESYKSWRSGLSMPAGTLIVAEHHAKQGSVQGPYYFAQKTATSGWQYGSATSDGWLLEPTTSCSLCHAEAIADHVFGMHPLATPSPDTKRPDGE